MFSTSPSITIICNRRSSLVTFDISALTLVREIWESKGQRNGKWQCCSRSVQNNATRLWMIFNYCESINKHNMKHPFHRTAWVDDTQGIMQKAEWIKRLINFNSFPLRSIFLKNPYHMLKHVWIPLASLKYMARMLYILNMRNKIIRNIIAKFIWTAKHNEYSAIS